jgi:phosphatidylserine decarboxylase
MLSAGIAGGRRLIKHTYKDIYPMEKLIDSYRPMPRQMYIAKEGHPFIAIAAVISLFFFAVELSSVAMFFIGVAAFVTYFFRNPERTVPKGEGLIISPADGRVLKVENDIVAPETGKKTTKVSIFMSVLNVHINRFPVSATVKKIRYFAGKFFVASLDKASEKNERNLLVLEDDEGREIVMVQIAGLIARRIICYFKEGASLERGDRFGLIRFGSRVDLYLSPETMVDVKKGDRVISGSTIIGRYL